jgi:hypothetical protein
MYHVKVQIKFEMSKALFKRIFQTWLINNLLNNFFTPKCGGSLDMLMMRIVGIILINHVMYNEWTFVCTARRLKQYEHDLGGAIV